MGIVSERTLRLVDRKDTIRLGVTVGERIKPGDVVALIGDLGAGKTTLVQGIARGAGYLETVSSPTYTLIHEYHANPPLIHIDPYRLERPAEMLELGLAEYLEQPYAILIEWADRIAGLLPVDRLDIEMVISPLESPDSSDDGTQSFDRPRSVRLHAGGERSQRLLDAVTTKVPDLLILQSGDAIVV